MCGAVRVQLRRNGLEVARVGISAAGLRTAVERNLLRRRLRETLRPRLAELRGHDLVLIAGAQAAQLPFSALELAVVHCLSRGRRHLAERAGAGTAETGENGQVRAPRAGLRP